VKWDDRITGFDRIPAKSIKPHPHNFRTHPERQRNIVTGLLNEVGWIDAVIVNETTGNLIDGHLRLEQALAMDNDVPVLFVKLSEAEEALALTTLDKSAELAGVDVDNLEILVNKIDVHDVAVQSFVKDIQVDVGLADNKGEGGDESAEGPDADNFQFTMRFSSVDQKEKFYDLLRWLKDTYPDADDLGHRFELLANELMEV